MTLTLRSTTAALVLCAGLAACGGGAAGDSAEDPTTEPSTPEQTVSFDGDWTGTVEDGGGEVSFFVDGTELEYFEAVIPHCDPGYTEDKAFTMESFEIAADGTVSGTVEDEYGGMGSTTLALDAAFDGDTFAGTLDWTGTADCSSEDVAFSATLQ